MRDEKLDIYRGLIMIYIVGVIHTLFWFPNTNNVLKTLFLFEMPVVFFITGASYSLSNKKDYLSYIVSRIPRILIPYFIFSLFVVFLQYVATILGTTISYAPNFLYNTLNPFKIPSVELKFVTWHLWFMPVYLYMIPFIPIMFIVFDKLKGIFKFIPFIIFAIIVFYMEGFDIHKNIKSIVFYSFWIYAGFFYTKFKDIKISKVLNISFTILSFLVLVILVKSDRYVLNMSTNKFPPNFIFLVFNLTAFSFLYFVRDYIFRFGNLKFVRNLVDIYSKYGFTLYLYQPFTYLLLQPIYVYLFNLFSDNLFLKVLLILLNIIVAIVFNTLFVKLFGKMETFKFRKK